jgi:hypothetical protein
MYFDILFISDFVQQVTSHKKLFVFATPDTEDLVQVIVSNVLMRYPTCYVMICDADIAVNSAQSTGDFQSTSSFQRFRSLHRRPTLTPCPASLPWVN